MALNKADQVKLAKIMKDPVAWAQAFLRTYNVKTGRVGPWKARWYQVEMMTDPSKKRVYRCGRRTGKTETMVVESLFHVCTKRNFRVLIVTPYESQVRLAFMRLNELIQESPVVKSMVVSNTKNPYMIKLSNESAILGFTTGASSGGGAASIRGQRADLIVMDEVDYMSEADFDSVMIIAGERPDIRTVMSSTPTGKRSKFYQACTDPKMGFNEHFHPSPHNPDWCDELEAEFRATLSEQGYVHEVEAEFGVQNTGVFDKAKVDLSKEIYNYTYQPLDYYQENAIKLSGMPHPDVLMYDRQHPAPYSRFRTIGVDWDKYGETSSIVVLEFNERLGKFMILKAQSVPRSEYSYDAAVKMIIDYNYIYKPAMIYCDRGAGEYQIEQLCIYGEQHPETRLHEKVKGWQFSQNLDVQNPVTGEIVKEPLKPFMVTQLQIAFEREQMVISKYDEKLYKQLIDYEVVKYAQNGKPIFTDVNEHFIDALGLAYLAMTLTFKDLTGVMKDRKTTNRILTSARHLISNEKAITAINRSNEVKPEIQSFYENYQHDEHPDEQQRWVKSDFSTYYKGNDEYRSTRKNSTWSRSGGLSGWRR
ncbi:MAG: DEAD/DEAH box helicase family protein [Romboutsia timonensis]